MGTREKWRPSFRMISPKIGISVKYSPWYSENEFNLHIRLYLFIFSSSRNLKLKAHIQDCAVSKIGDLIAWVSSSPPSRHWVPHSNSLPSLKIFTYILFFSNNRCQGGFWWNIHEIKIFIVLLTNILSKLLQAFKMYILITTWIASTDLFLLFTM